MLLPYYIASMNIEHAYMERVGEYRTFEGICLVDTFDLAEPQKMQLEFMTEGNTERIRKQKKAPIRVVIGNPNTRSKRSNNPASPGPSASKRCPSARTRASSATTTSSPCAASRLPPSTTASATAPPSNGSSTSTASPPTPAPASSTTPTARTTPTTSSASSNRSSPSPSKPRRSS